MNYKNFCHRLCNSNQFNAVYYVGEVKQRRGYEHNLKLYSGQQMLFENLRSKNIQIKLGYLLKNNGKFQEKGVDVQIAVDMVDGAADNLYDTCYLISSDTDLIPAIKSALKRGKSIIYIAFQNQVSTALSRICTKTIILDKDFFDRDNLT